MCEYMYVCEGVCVRVCVCGCETLILLSHKIIQTSMTFFAHQRFNAQGDGTLAAPSMVDIGSNGSDGTVTPPNGRNATFTIGTPEAAISKTRTEGTETPPSARAEKLVIGEGADELPEKSSESNGYGKRKDESVIYQI